MFSALVRDGEEKAGQFHSLVATSSGSDKDGGGAHQ